MKRLVLLLAVLIAVAIVIFFFVSREKSAATANGVASLLPADTVVLIHIPDVERNRDDWQKTDLSQLYHEPAMQDFLRKPREQFPKNGALAEAWRDSASLRMRDVFVATDTVDSLRLIAGFEFRCEEKEGRKVIDRWKERWSAQGAQRTSSDYKNYAIDTFTSPRWTMATVVVGHRFFAATKMDDLQGLLDRLDGRAKDSRLAADENFLAAMKQMPADYAALLYVQPKPFAQKLMTLRAQNGRALPPGQQTLIEQLRSFSHAIVFDGAKLRDIDFAAMPRLVDAKLTRDTLDTASSDTLIYLALILNLRQQLETEAKSSFFAGTGVTPEDWQSAFGDEMSLLAEWPANARMPDAVATLAVRDTTRARTVVHALAAKFGWQTSTRGNFEYFTAPPSGLAVMRLMAAVSEKRLGIGLDGAMVERAISPPSQDGKLASTPAFKESSRLVPEPQQMFAWLDLPTLYGRLDATLRPLLQISAAFMSDASSRFDVAKLPSAETVTKHLSPVVASQSYVDGGYRSESAGTITLGQAALLGVGGYAGWELFQKQGGVSALLKNTPSMSPAAPTPSPTP